MKRLALCLKLTAFALLVSQNALAELSLSDSMNEFRLNAQRRSAAYQRIYALCQSNLLSWGTSQYNREALVSGIEILSGEGEVLSWTGRVSSNPLDAGNYTYPLGPTLLSDIHSGGFSLALSDCGLSTGEQQIFVATLVWLDALTKAATVGLSFAVVKKWVWPQFKKVFLRLVPLSEESQKTCSSVLMPVAAGAIATMGIIDSISAGTPDESISTAIIEPTQPIDYHDAIGFNSENIDREGRERRQLLEKIILEKSEALEDDTLSAEEHRKILKAKALAYAYLRFSKPTKSQAQDSAE